MHSRDKLEGNLFKDSFRSFDGKQVKVYMINGKEFDGRLKVKCFDSDVPCLKDGVESVSVVDNEGKETLISTNFVMWIEEV